MNLSYELSKIDKCLQVNKPSEALSRGVALRQIYPSNVEIYILLSKAALKANLVERAKLYFSYAVHLTDGDIEQLNELMVLGKRLGLPWGLILYQFAMQSASLSASGSVLALLAKQEEAQLLHKLFESSVRFFGLQALNRWYIELNKAYQSELLNNALEQATSLTDREYSLIPHFLTGYDIDNLKRLINQRQLVWLGDLPCEQHKIIESEPALKFFTGSAKSDLEALYIVRHENLELIPSSADACILLSTSTNKINTSKLTRNCGLFYWYTGELGQAFSTAHLVAELAKLKRAFR